MTQRDESAGGDSAFQHRPRRRRWKSSQEAYDAGVRAGMLAMVDLVALLNDPGIITELGEGFAANLRAVVGLDPKS